MTPVDNSPGGEDYEDYERGDLSGIVMDMYDGMIRVRFVGDHSTTQAVRLVVRADGSLGIDPSGLPKVRQRRISDFSTKLEPNAEVVDATIVKELEPGE